MSQTPETHPALWEFPSEDAAPARRRHRHAAFRSSAMVIAFGCGLLIGGLAVWTIGDAAYEPPVVKGGTTLQSLQPLDVSLARDALAVSRHSDDRHTSTDVSARPAVSSRPPSRRAFRGALFVESGPPGAQVFLNGRAAGQTPLLLDNQPVGSRAVRVVLDGYDPWTSTVQIVTGRQARLRAQLKAGPSEATR